MLEENIARTIGSIGESVAAGAVFTIPAFVIAGAWPIFDFEQRYWKSSSLMVVGGTLGILFVTLLRRVMVEDPELPFPNRWRPREIHKAGQQGSRAAKILFANMGFGGSMYLLGAVQVCSVASNDFPREHRRLGQELRCASAPATASQPRHRRRLPRSRLRPSARPISAWATSSDRGWPR